MHLNIHGPSTEKKWSQKQNNRGTLGRPLNHWLSLALYLLNVRGFGQMILSSGSSSRQDSSGGEGGEVFLYRAEIVKWAGN